MVLNIENVKVVEDQLLSDTETSYAILKNLKVRRGCATEKNKYLKRIREIDYDMSKEIESNSGIVESKKLDSLKIERMSIVKSLLELQPIWFKCSDEDLEDSYKIESLFAKKNCTCDCCDEKIGYKEYYKRESGHYDGESFSRNLCMGCYATLDHYRKNNEKFFNMSDIVSNYDLSEMQDCLTDECGYCEECSECTKSVFSCTRHIYLSEYYSSEKKETEV